MNDIKLVNLCRCCLAENEPVKDMQSEDFSIDGKLIDGFKLCSGIELDIEDKLTTSICQPCEVKLKVSYEFRKLCKASDTTLKERLLVKEEVTSDNEVNERMEFIYTEFLPPVISPKSVEDEQFPNIFSQSFGETKEETEEVFTSVLIPDIKMEDAEVKVNRKSTKSTKKERKSAAGNAQVYLDTVGYSEEYETNQQEMSEVGDKIRLEGNFSCDICDEIFDTFKDHNEHKVKHIWDGGIRFIKRVCKLCNQMTDNYLRHLKLDHPDYLPNSCRKCGKGFSKPGNLQYHLKSHIDGTMYPCKGGCNEVFPNKSRLKNHIVRTKHTPDLYHCYECGLGFKVINDFLEHFKVHYDDTIRRKFFPCFDCKNIFMRLRFLSVHVCDKTKPTQKKNMSSKQIQKLKSVGEGGNKKGSKLPANRKNTGKVNTVECSRCSEMFSCEDEVVCHQLTFCTGLERFICKQCNKELASAAHLALHVVNIHGEKNLICDQCGFKCATQIVLKKHIDTHLETREFKCKKCTMTFRDERGWKLHQKSHEDKNYECHICGKKYRSLTTIRLHMPVHIKALRKFACEICDKTYVRINDLDRHMTSHTGHYASCELCGKEYKDRKGLRHHMRKVHEGIRYECYVCHQSLSSRTILYEHLFLHRGFKPFNCEVCAKPFLTRERFKKHLLTHNIKFDEKTHGYREKDKNIFKIVDACALKNGEKLSEAKLTEIGTLPGLPYSNEEDAPNTSNNAFQAIEPMLAEFGGDQSF